jgi:hypothetical protein
VVRLNLERGMITLDRLAGRISQMARHVIESLSGRNPMGRLLVLTLILVATALSAAAPAAAQDDADVQNRLIELAQQRPSIAGPLNGQLPTALGMVHTQAARVEVRDFYATATFTNPDSEEELPWDVGISFRRTPIDGLAFILDSSGIWSFEQGMQSIIASGPIASLATGPGEINVIDLVAIGGEGYVAVNGQYVATLDLSVGGARGDIAVGVAYLAKNQRPDNFTLYDGFEIWSLDRSTQAPGTEPADVVMSGLMAQATASAVDAGPFSGELLLEEDEIDYSTANVHVRDFYAHAVFTNPYPASEHPWDIGFGFRDPDTRVQRALRLVIGSDGAWFLSLGPNPYQVSGQGAQLQTGAGERNEVDLVASGDTGYLSVNGAFVAAIDLSASDIPGEVWVSSGFFAENTLVGETTEYTEFRVWFLQPAEPSEETAEVVVWGNGEVLFDLRGEGGSGVSGLVSVAANGAQTTVEVGVVGTTEQAQVGIYTGTCGNFAPPPAYALEPVLATTLSSVTTLDAGFETLTDGAHLVAISASEDEGGAVLACNEIPSQAAATG